MWKRSLWLCTHHTIFNVTILGKVQLVDLPPVSSSGLTSTTIVHGNLTHRCNRKNNVRPKIIFFFKKEFSRSFAKDYTVLFARSRQILRERNTHQIYYLLTDFDHPPKRTQMQWGHRAQNAVKADVKWPIEVTFLRWWERKNGWSSTTNRLQRDESTFHSVRNEKHVGSGQSLRDKSQRITNKNKEADIKLTHGAVLIKVMRVLASLNVSSRKRE